MGAPEAFTGCGICEGNGCDHLSVVHYEGVCVECQADEIAKLRELVMLLTAVYYEQDYERIEALKAELGTREWHWPED
jgi:hypothetical protein